MLNEDYTEEFNDGYDVTTEGFTEDGVADEGAEHYKEAIIRDADYKAVLTPDIIKTGTVAVIFLITLFGIKGILASRTPYAKTMLIIFLLVMVGLSVLALSLITGTMETPQMPALPQLNF